MKTPGIHLRRLMVVAGLLVLFASPAQALRCQDWINYVPNERREVVNDEVDRILNSNEARRWTSINLHSVRRCSMRYFPHIEDEFDDACSRGQSVSMRALDEILLRYVRSCAM